MSKSEPTLDQYTQLKNQLTQQILKKQDIDARLSALEESIYDKETDYFNESTYGNIVKGFDNFAKSLSGSSSKKKMVYTEDDHIFSMSSATFVKALSKREGSAAPDLDDYEDSVDPNGGNNASGKDSNSGTPVRKRKSRFDEK